VKNIRYLFNMFLDLSRLQYAVKDACNQPDCYRIFLVYHSVGVTTAPEM